MESSVKEAGLTVNQEHRKWHKEKHGNGSRASCFGTKDRRVVRNYPLITKELLTDEVNLYLLMWKHIQDILAEQYVEQETICVWGCV